MKILLYTIMMLLLGSCTKNSQDQDTFITVLKDVTDNLTLKPNSNAILGIYNLKDHKQAAAGFRYCEVTNMVLNPTIDLILPGGSVTEQNNKNSEPLFRERAILNFYDSIRKVMAVSGLRPLTTLPNSMCFEAVAAELTLLTKNNYQRKFLLCYSNLFQNSSLFNAYNTKVQKEISDHPAAIAQQLENTHLLPGRLTGIVVVFLYLPQTPRQDNLFAQMVTIYKMLLQPRGAIVRVQASNNFMNF